MDLMKNHIRTSKSKGSFQSDSPVETLETVKTSSVDI